MELFPNAGRLWIASAEGIWRPKVYLGRSANSGVLRTFKWRNHLGSMITIERLAITGHLRPYKCWKCLGPMIAMERLANVDRVGDYKCRGLCGQISLGNGQRLITVFFSFNFFCYFTYATSLVCLSYSLIKVLKICICITG